MTNVKFLKTLFGVWKTARIEKEVQILFGRGIPLHGDLRYQDTIFSHFPSCNSEVILLSQPKQWSLVYHSADLPDCLCIKMCDAPVFSPKQ